MIKQCGHYITFQEVPNEVSLTFTISNCPYKCDECHSPWLQQNIGDELTFEDIKYYISLYKEAITCICFMGTGNNLVALGELINKIHEAGYRTCIYTGKNQDEFEEMIRYFIEHNIHIPEYIKYGPYQKELGGLSSSTTNQKMLKAIDNYWEDITSTFWQKKE